MVRKVLMTEEEHGVKRFNVEYRTKKWTNGRGRRAGFMAARKTR
jgi:hypothetical protein